MPLRRATTSGAVLLAVSRPSFAAGTDFAVLDPLAAHTSPGGALIEFGSTATHYDTRAVAFETFARPLWGLTSLLAGGGSYDGVERWVSGLAQGTNPQGPEYWGAAKV